jgi:hypothetical protein
MTMSLAQIRLRQNPVLTSLLLGVGQGNYIAQSLFPRLPSALSAITLVKTGDESRRRYNLRRAPGSATKRVNIQYDGQVYTVNEYSVDVPIPRELIREQIAMQRMNVGDNLDISRIAVSTGGDILNLDYELEAASIATDSATYAAGNTLAYAGGTKWSAATGTPVTDFRAATDVIRKKIGKKPNTATFSPDAWSAFIGNAEVRGYLPSTQMGPATTEQAKVILDVPTILIGGAVWVDETNAGQDVWGNNAVLAYVPVIGGNGSDISLAEPALGFTQVIEGNPFVEQPYYESQSKSWIYGATFERKAQIAYNTAGFLFQNCK